VVPGGDQQHPRRCPANPVQAQQARATGRQQRDDQLIQALELGVQELGAAAGFAQRQ
jgi:hypothetical protein